MSEFRMGKNDKEHYASFDELRTAWGLKTINKQTNDVNKLNSQREKFCSRNCCRACGQPMSYYPNGSNTMVCLNDKCKGIKIENEDKEGNKIITYAPSYKLLDEHSAEIAKTLFAEN